MKKIFKEIKKEFRQSFPTLEVSIERVKKWWRAGMPSLDIETAGDIDRLSQYRHFLQGAGIPQDEISRLLGGTEILYAINFPNTSGG